AGAAVLEDAEAFIEKNVGWLAERRDAAVAALRAAGLDLRSPAATLYLWFPVPGGVDGRDWCRRLLEEEAVVLMPGLALGAGGAGFVRASLTLPAERYAELTERIGRVRAIGSGA
ncbi:MAG: aminotransferase class I/II-fold pyridoxal phosphate-dependent enzyme, partial [Gemmatimonadota bacterium]|nr:aminotransferase class I/II-fold pyridoxal phosphate-dependent enzyme [Gemmatimonadota bacterium]